MPAIKLARLGQACFGTAKGDGTDTLRAAYTISEPTRLTMLVVGLAVVGGPQPGGTGSGTCRVYARVVQEEDIDGQLMLSNLNGPNDARSNRSGTFIAAHRCVPYAESPLKIPLGYVVGPGERVIVEVTGGNDGGTGAAMDLDASICLIGERSTSGDA